jgi:hypothetical protein
MPMPPQLLLLLILLQKWTTHALPMPPQLLLLLILLQKWTTHALPMPPQLLLLLIPACACASRAPKYPGRASSHRRCRMQGQNELQQHSQTLGLVHCFPGQGHCHASCPSARHWTWQRV